MTPTEEDGNSAPRKGPLTETTHEYSEAATIHGIYYIFERGRCSLERFLWIVVVLLALLFAVILTFTPNPALAEIGGLTKCSESPAFTKRLNASVKKLEQRMASPYLLS